MRRAALASAALAVVLALAACSGQTPNGAAGANASASAAGGAPAAAAPTADAGAPLYPDWAKAVAPPYPNAMVAILVNTRLYQFQSADDPATVFAWYKAHVTAAWSADATDGTESATVNGVQISISRNTLTAGDAAKVKTMIELHN